MYSHYITTFLVLTVLSLGCVEKETKENGGVHEMKLENKKILLILPPEDFRDEEFFKPLNVFKENNFNVTIASKGVEKAVGMFGSEVLIDSDIEKVNVDDYDVIVFVGGSGAKEYFNDPTALLIAKEAASKGKIVAAICIAPVILANANLLEGKKATVWSSLSDKTFINKIKEKGAVYVSDYVVQDGKIITANGPNAAEKFAERIVGNFQ